MDTNRLQKFAQDARGLLLEQVEAKLARVLAEGSLARRESAPALKELEEQIASASREEVIEQIAYTWFNRFCALRYMDVNRYTRIGTVSPADGFQQPEILLEAKQGHIDDNWLVDQDRVRGLLDGSLPSDHPQQEAYRLLLVAVCNSCHALMPFLFEKIADYTELLLPDDLLSDNSILTQTRRTLTPEDCENVEVIGWLYQFYVSEKKDTVFADLKKGKKIAPEGIPAATQLFTPHWIVRYLVENSLGRLWMLNHPESKLIAQMDYYIRPEEPETDFLRIGSPEQIKVCDPACGSGHMLTYAFDLLYAIYEEQGYAPNEIPALILQHNLYGIEIDQRAGALAAFALTMKARERYRRFLQSGKVAQPRICVLEKIPIEPDDLSAYMDYVGRELFSDGLQSVLHQFEEADNMGSLIRPAVSDVREVLAMLCERKMGEDLFLADVHRKVLKALKQADYLSPKYHVVVANPPYMSSKGMNPVLKEFAQEHYSSSKADLFAMFIERNCDFAVRHGNVAMITMQSWMFLSSFEKLREDLLRRKTVLSMAHLGPRAFDTIGGEVVTTAAFVLSNAAHPDYTGVYHRLTAGKDEQQKSEMFLGGAHASRVSANDLLRVPSAPIAYWASPRVRELFASGSALSDVAPTKIGMRTGNNDLYLRSWYEVPFDEIAFGTADAEAGEESGRSWFPYNKGGEYRKWYGNNETVVLWKSNGYEIKRTTLEKYPQLSWDNLGWKISNESCFFKPSLTWTFVSSSSFAVRVSDPGFLFDVGGSCAFPQPNDIQVVAGYLCSKLSFHFLQNLNPTLNFQISNVADLPWVDPQSHHQRLAHLATECIDIARRDWDALETSWNFQRIEVLAYRESSDSLQSAYASIRHQWRIDREKCETAEEELNRTFATIYGLEDEIDIEIARDQITLSRNPYYRYGCDKSESELEALLLADTMREFISCAVGCMFGRYSLDKPGLILANRGETADDYRRIVGEYLVLSNEQDGDDESEQLSGLDRVAEGDGRGGDDISGNQAVSEGGDLRTDESDSQSSRLDSVEHRGGTGTQVNAGLQEVSADRSGIESGSGNATSAGSTSALPNSGTTGADPESARRNQQDDQLASGEAQVTDNSLLDTHFSFLPDEDNVIPLLDGDWFTDDIGERFKTFLKITFGTEQYEENLTFLENALYPDNLQGKKQKTIRDYFLKDFYSHHVKMYKKRPIYWMFSSPKGTFNALIYMHRYRPHTVSVVLNDYLREFHTKLSAKMDHLQAVADSGTAGKAEKAKALKEIARLKKNLKELEDYEHHVLYPLATRQVEIDLEDGVKVNYNKFGRALKKVPGLSG